MKKKLLKKSINKNIIISISLLSCCSLISFFPLTSCSQRDDSNKNDIHIKKYISKIEEVTNSIVSTMNNFSNVVDVENELKNELNNSLPFEDPIERVSVYFSDLNSETKTKYVNIEIFFSDEMDCDFDFDSKYFLFSKEKKSLISKEKTFTTNCFDMQKISMDSNQEQLITNLIISELDVCNGMIEKLEKQKIINEIEKILKKENIIDNFLISYNNFVDSSSQEKYVDVSIIFKSYIDVEKPTQVVWNNFQFDKSSKILHSINNGIKTNIKNQKITINLSNVEEEIFNSIQNICLKIDDFDDIEWAKNKILVLIENEFKSKNLVLRIDLSFSDEYDNKNKAFLDLSIHFNKNLIEMTNYNNLNYFAFDKNSYILSVKEEKLISDKNRN